MSRSDGNAPKMSCSISGCPTSGPPDGRLLHQQTAQIGACDWCDSSGGLAAHPAFSQRWLFLQAPKMPHAGQKTANYSLDHTVLVLPAGART
ncbi:hypothetical protein EV356DRAFT_502075 [Viridothelium virens]|uniref:Uncharacterized protein n=1 Tax=Viridothelium virens TaxID=1048519 RepID=A0A6A6HMP2_VIRVR|nr:hypothetical protein EV356DRAFT_502075 [Viridothelium virens]